MRKIRVPKAINARRDFIRRGYCDQCHSEDVSVVIHHPQRGRPFTICNRCSHPTWAAVGVANVDNWMTTGRQTEWVPRPNSDGQRRDRRPHDKQGNKPSGNAPSRNKISDRKDG